MILKILSFSSGGFLLLRDHKHKRNVGLNCFLRSSQTLDLDNYESRQSFGTKSVAIPGELKCLQYVYHKYAKLDPFSYSFFYLFDFNPIAVNIDSIGKHWQHRL